MSGPCNLAGEGWLKTSGPCNLAGEGWLKNSGPCNLAGEGWLNTSGPCYLFENCGARLNWGDLCTMKGLNFILI